MVLLAKVIGVHIYPPYMNFLEDYILVSNGCCILEFLHVQQSPKLSF